MVIIREFDATNFTQLFATNEFVVFHILHEDQQILVEMNKTGEINFSRIVLQLSPGWRYDNWIRLHKNKLKMLEAFEGLPVSRFIYRSRRQRDLFLVFPLAILFIYKFDFIFCWRLFQCYEKFLKLKLA